MKKLSIIAILIANIAACSSASNEGRESGTILSRKVMPENQVELVVQKENGELVVIYREDDEHSQVGSTLYLDEMSDHLPF